MGANKILTFGQNSTNILSDAAYQSSSERTAGNGQGTVASSQLMNKVLKQVTAVSNAIGTIVANNNNFDASDDNPSNLAIGLANAFNSLRVASFAVSLTASNTWELTTTSQVDLSVPFLIAFSCTDSSRANEFVRINSSDFTDRIPIYLLNGSRIQAGDISASTSSPFPVLLLIHNNKAVYFRDLPQSTTNNVATQTWVNTQLSGFVPSTRTVNNKALSEDITLSPSDIGAVPTTRTVNGKALSSNITLSASDVGAATSAQGTLATNAMPKSGGTFTGLVKANAVSAPTTPQIVNMVVYPAGTDISDVPVSSFPAGTLIGIIEGE